MFCKVDQLGPALTLHDIAQTLADMQSDGWRQTGPNTETQKS